MDHPNEWALVVWFGIVGLILCGPILVEGLAHACCWLLISLCKMIDWFDKGGRHEAP
jgi:hypothetical protein